jgi:hypothetical protein
VVVVRTRGFTVRGRIADLSASGVRLRVESRVGIEALAGRRVGIELHLDGPGTEWLYLRGCVVRVSPAFLTIVIAFESVPVDFAEIIDREGRNAITH